MNDIETRVRDAITMNVDLMDGPSRIIERALASVDQVRRRRRRRRALVGALAVTVAVGAVAGVAAATRDHRSGVTVTAGSPTSRVTVPQPLAPGPSALIAGWNPVCGSAPKLASVPGLRFTLSFPSKVVGPGQSLRAVSVLSNPTGHAIELGTGVGAWYVTTPSGRLVATSAGYAVITIGYRVEVPAHGLVAPSYLATMVDANAGACAPAFASPVSPLISPPLPRGRYLAWYGLPLGSYDRVFVSEPAAFEVGGAPRWSVGVTRSQALALGRRNAIDPTTTIVQAKLASWAEIRGAGASLGTSPTDRADRRVWVVSVSGPPHPGLCCLAPHQPFRWGVLFVDATTGDPFSFSGGSTGNIAPWFARVPDHGA